MSLEALKHVGDRWALSFSAGWVAQWVADPVNWTPAYNDALFFSARRFSFVSLSGSVKRQLTDHVALGIAPSVDQGTDCVSPFCDWKNRSAQLSLLMNVRPLWWLSAIVAPAVGVRERSDMALPPTPPHGTPIVVQPRSVTWVSLSGQLAF